MANEQPKSLTVEAMETAKAILAKKPDFARAYDERFTLPEAFSSFSKLQAEMLELGAKLDSDLLEARRTLAKWVNSSAKTDHEYGNYVALAKLQRGHLVFTASARKVQLHVMFPEISGEDGCRIVPVGPSRFKNQVTNLSTLLSESMLKAVTVE